MRTKRLAQCAALLLLAVLVLPTGGTAASGHTKKTGSVSPLAGQAVDDGLAPAAQPVAVTVGLQLRNQGALDAFLAQASDPASPLFAHWLTQDQFNALYAPTADQESAVIAWLTSSGFTVTQTFPNRLLVSAVGDAAAAANAFQVNLHKVHLDGQAGYAILDEPSFPSEVAGYTTGVMGLDDLAQVRALHGSPAQAKPHDNLGSNCCYFSPRDLNNFYGEDHNGAHTGSGQTAVIVGAFDFHDSDFAAFNTQMALPNPPVTRVCAGGSGTGCGFDASNSVEVSLDVEYAHGTAPSAGLVSVMAKTTALTDFTTAYNQVVTGNYGHAVTTSWGLCEQSMAAATRASDDSIFANGAAIGQSWFAASGDSGSKDCGTTRHPTTGVDYPASSPYVMGVGGTHPTCLSGSFIPSNPVCSGYGSESGWTGSGGGSSVYYSKPSWQTGCNAQSAGTLRAVPDVSLEADTTPGNLVAFNGGWYAVGGTSDAAPQMAGVFAALNQAKGGSGVGLPGARLYQLCAGASFHDVTSGSNGGFSAVAGYDRVTGIGSVNEGNLIANY